MPGETSTPRVAGEAAERFDRLTLSELAKAGGDLTKPTDVVGFLCFPSEEAARRAADELQREGYRVVVQHAVMGAKWLTQAHRDLVLTPETVATQRARFEALAATCGGEYSGWEAAVMK